MVSIIGFQLLFDIGNDFVRGHRRRLLVRPDIARRIRGRHVCIFGQQARRKKLRRVVREEEVSEWVIGGGRFGRRSRLPRCAVADFAMAVNRRFGGRQA
jgi:hypothetical protein